MAKQPVRTLSVFIPLKKQHLNLVERSVNYLVVQAISEFLSREEEGS
jgi:hypothetical protein